MEYPKTNTAKPVSRDLDTSKVHQVMTKARHDAGMECMRVSIVQLVNTRHSILIVDTTTTIIMCLAVAMASLMMHTVLNARGAGERHIMHYRGQGHSQHEDFGRRGV